IPQHPVPENVYSRVEQRTSGKHRNPQQRIFKIYACRSEIDDVCGQRLRKTTCTNQAATAGVNNQPRECSHEQRLPCVALQSNVNNNYEGEVDVSQRPPNLAQQKL